MEWSKYNIMFKSERFNCYLLYNSLSNALIKLEEPLYQELLKIKNRPESLVDDDLRQKLQTNKILVKSNRLEFYKFHLLKNSKRFNRKLLSLTIAPTSDCNFRCPYCFEKGAIPCYMTDDTEQELIQFIRMHKEAEFLDITWYGGEPLLAYDRIKSITSQLETLSLRFVSRIVTNGYNLNETIIKELPGLHFESIHITLDGLKERHNSRRPHYKQADSFEQIVHNIELISSLTPQMKVIIRVNIDKENKEEYHRIYAYLKDRFPESIRNIYPGFVKKTYGRCDASEKNLLSNEEQTDFLIDQYQLHKIMDHTHFFPHSHYSECIARCINGYLVAPDGYLYKCWTDLGNQKEAVGHLSGKEMNVDNLAKYMMGGDPFCDAKCQKCYFLPVCGGGCPHQKLKNIFGETKTNVCHISKSQIEKFIELYYEKNFVPD